MANAIFNFFKTKIIDENNLVSIGKPSIINVLVQEITL
jgi:hypothetical protein